MVNPHERVRPDAGGDSTFGDGQPTWLGRLGHVRNVVRQEMITRQLGQHLRTPSARVLDVGAGQGTQSIRLARAGHHVLAVENWYGVRIAVDSEELAPAPSSDPGELSALLDVEERLGASDPYRQLAQLAHLILRKASTAPAGG